MKLIGWGTLVAALLPVCRFAAAQTNLLSGSNQGGPVIAVTPSVLNFGLVAVGRTTDLTLKVQNVGEGMLTGTATVAAPFSVDPHTYSLGSGQSRLLTVRYKPTAQETNGQWVVSSGANTAAVAVTGYARQRPRPPASLKVKPSVFADEAEADFIVRYYSDATSYVLKPSMMDGKVMGTRGAVEFFLPCSRADVLKAAADQRRRELAVFVLVHYPGGTTLEEPVKQNWERDLKALGYQRVIFLRGSNKTRQVNGLTLLEGQPAPAWSAEK